MKYFLPYIGILLSILTISHAAADEQSHFVIAKYGRYTINKSNQTTTYATSDYGCGYICGDVSRDSVELDIDKHSKLAAAIEYEWDMDNGIFLSGEITILKNNYSASINPEQRGVIQTNLYNINLKKYFNHTSLLRPFIGGGIGFAIAEFDGPLHGDADGFTTNIKLGTLYHIGRIGVVAEYQYIYGPDIETNVNENTKQGDIAGKYNLDGYILFLGVRIGFI